MKTNLENPLSVLNVVESLFNGGLISNDPEEMILRHEAAFHGNTDKTAYPSGRPGTGDINPAVIIDQIAALKIERWDDPEKILDNIARVVHMKVKPVVSSRADIIRLLDEF